MAIRNGRFVSDGTATIKIVDERVGVYRIFNSGANPFSIESDTVGSFVVALESSVDLPATTLNVATGSSLEGIYQMIDGDEDLRSGKFRSEVGTNVTISAVPGVYRVLNSSPTAELKVYDDTRLITTLKPTFSIDVKIDDSLKIEGAGTGAVSGIYDRLDIFGAARSGRFRFHYKFDGTGKPVNPGYPHLISDLSNDSATAGTWYRIFNSGQEDIYLSAGPKADNLTPVATIKPNNSFDFKAKKAPVANRKYWVSTDVPTTNFKPIEGSFDLVKRVE